MKTLLLLVILLALGITDGQECPADIQDETIYHLGYNYYYPPFQNLNDDGELIGLSYDLMRSVCRVMKKQCVHTVYYGLKHCWDINKASNVLNNDWWDACVGLYQTYSRRSAYAFQGEYAMEQASYIYVKQGSRFDTLDEIRNNAKIGFLRGWWTSPRCLQRYLGSSLTGRMMEDYALYSDISRALNNGEVDAIFVTESDIKDAGDESRFVRVGNERIKCAYAGLSVMMRKDRAHKFEWINDGIRELRRNGEYDWLCNHAEMVGNPDCFPPEY